MLNILESFNLSILSYQHYIGILKTENPNDSSIQKNLKELDEKFKCKDFNIEMLNFVVDKLKNFSETYAVDVQETDDFKVAYFIALFFLKEDKGIEKKIVLLILHKIMCSSLLIYEPKDILCKLEKFILEKSSDKFLEEYGDIGYYHMIKSIYLMQKTVAKSIIEIKNISFGNPLVQKYFEK